MTKDHTLPIKPFFWERYVSTLGIVDGDGRLMCSVKGASEEFVQHIVDALNVAPDMSFNPGFEVRLHESRNRDAAVRARMVPEGSR